MRLRFMTMLHVSSGLACGRQTDRQTRQTVGQTITMPYICMVAHVSVGKQEARLSLRDRASTLSVEIRIR